MARKRMPLFALLILPSLVGVLLISYMSWRHFDPAVERSSEVALSMMEDMIKSVGSEVLRYPLAVGDEDSVKRIVRTMAENELVFAVQVEDAEGNVVVRAQNAELPIDEGIRLLEYRESLYIEGIEDEFMGESEPLYVGEALYQLTPHVMTREKERLVGEYRVMIGALLGLGLIVILAASRILWRSANAITRGLKRIASGEGDVRVDQDSFVAEFDVIGRGVNQLSKNVDEANRDQAEAMLALEQAVEQAQQSDRETRSFYEMATREIADPVNQVVKLLKMNRESGEETVDLDLILANAERVKVSVLAMLGKLNDEAGREDENEVELRDYFSLLEEEYRPRFDVKQLGYFVESNRGSDQAQYRIDVRTLDIVLEKLLENALKFTPEGEVRVQWGVTAFDGDEHMLSIAVKDNGIGIDQENQSRIFDRYQKYEEGESPRGGSGLGLYIAKELIEREGGTLSVVSQRGVGSEFSVKLPIRRGRDVQTEKFKVKGQIALNVGLNDSDRSILEENLSSNEMVNLHTDTAIEALAMMADRQVNLLVVDDAVDDIDVDSFIDEASKRQTTMFVAVLIPAGSDEVMGESVFGKPLSKATINKLLDIMTRPRELAGVDYRLLERFRARRDE